MDRWRRPMRRCSRMATRMETVINPMPPTWITACPKRVNWVQVSYSTSPVTQEADAEVKSASRNGRAFPSREDSGRASSTPPSRISAANPRASV